MKMGVIHSLISRAKVICQDHKDFNREIKNIRYDLVLDEYPQEFTDSIIKPSRSNCPSCTIYQAMVIIPFIKGISEIEALKTVSVSGPFIKTKHKSCGTLVKTGPVRDSQ
jgi:hypothetical protein